MNINDPSDKSAAQQQADEQAGELAAGQRPARFDKAQVREAFDRAAHRYDHSALLQKEVTGRLLEKLDVVRISPDWILDAGCGTGSALAGLAKRYSGSQLVALDISRNMLQQCAGHGSRLNRPLRVCADMEQLPFASDSFDLIFSSLSLQWCNDLDAAFREAFRVLKPGGLYVFASFGPDTLKELRESWRRVDGREHVNRFEDMHDVGDALLRDGFAEPVMEAEIITVTYRDTDTIMKDLKSIGASVKETSAAVRGRDEQASGLGGRDRLRRLREEYESYRKDGVLPVSYEIIYGHAWKLVDDRTRKVAFSPR